MTLRAPRDLELEQPHRCMDVYLLRLINVRTEALSGTIHALWYPIPLIIFSAWSSSQVFYTIRHTAMLPIAFSHLVAVAIDPSIRRSIDRLTI